LKSNRFFLFSILTFSYFILQAQVNPDFIKHLSKLELQTEHNFYLENFKPEEQSDSLFYFKSKYFLQYKNDSLLFANYLKSKSLFMADSNSFNLAGIQFLTSHLKLKYDFFTSFNADESGVTMRNLHTAYLASINPSKFKGNDFPEAFNDVFLKFEKLNRRKPFIAGALSAAVPGLGKLYAGRRNSFLASFLSQTIYGFASYESIKNFGPAHPFSLLSMGFFSVFYVSNIYGSANAVKQAKSDYQKQFLLDAGHYYHIHHTGSLY
jgi:hypothetical protein